MSHKTNIASHCYNTIRRLGIHSEWRYSYTDFSVFAVERETFWLMNHVTQIHLDYTSLMLPKWTMKQWLYSFLMQAAMSASIVSEDYWLVMALWQVLGRRPKGLMQIVSCNTLIILPFKSQPGDLACYVIIIISNSMVEIVEDLAGICQVCSLQGMSWKAKRCFGKERKYACFCLIKILIIIDEFLRIASIQKRTDTIL